jgi:hypothetical protein
MRGCQHHPGRDERAGAEIAARADDGDDGAADAFRRRRATADDGVGRSERSIAAPAVIRSSILICAAIARTARIAKPRIGLVPLIIPC